MHIPALIQLLLFSGRICDEKGNFIPPDTPPCHSDVPHDWKPYSNRLQFELADFLFRRNQMSAGDINFILGLWAASLAIHNDEPPFSNTKELYKVIDSTPLGDVAWQSFSLQHNGTRPAGDIPSWMQAEYDVWFRDPQTIVQNMLSNPDFKSDFDYAPFQEYSADGIHRFRDFMSGIWAWQKAVSSRYSLFSHHLILIFY
jgi:Plavaka transposase